MGSVAHAERAPARAQQGEHASTALSLGVVTLFLSVIVALPLAAVVMESTKKGGGGFWDVVTQPQAMAALKLSFFVALVVTAINAVAGTAIAWVLVRDRFPGKRLVNAIIDLPFALPTIVAGMTLVALYGPKSPVGINVQATRVGIALALLFVTLPFVVRTVQPVLLELDTEMEEAGRALGASELGIFRRIVLPNILPGILSGVALAFARAIGEIGSVVIISSNLPFKTEVASYYILGRIEGGDRAGAAAVAVVLLVVSFLVILLIGGIRRLATRHEHA